MRSVGKKPLKDCELRFQAVKKPFLEGTLMRKQTCNVTERWNHCVFHCHKNTRRQHNLPQSATAIYTVLMFSFSFFCLKNVFIIFFLL